MTLLANSYLLANHDDVDSILRQIQSSQYLDRDDSTKPPQNSRIEGETQVISSLLTRRHNQHQVYLRQQDILGTFYDTLSIFQSLTLFTNLQKIRVLDFENLSAEDSGQEPWLNRTGRQRAIVRAFYSIVKVLDYGLDLSFLQLKTLEFDRLDYVALKKSYDTPNQLEAKYLQPTFHGVPARISVLKIHNLTNYTFDTLEDDNEETLTCACYFWGLSLMQSTLQELSLSDGYGALPSLHSDNPDLDFPWGSMSLAVHSGNRYYGYIRVLQKARGRMFPNLRKLELSGHKNVDMLSFAGMFMSLTPGILKELILDSLGICTGSWHDLFRIIAQKKGWVDTKMDWPGAFAHNYIQRSMYTYMNPDRLELLRMHLHTKLRRSRRPMAMIDRETLWKGLQLEKCKLRNLCYLGFNHESESVIRDAVLPLTLRTFEQWMTEGLDEVEYDALLT